MKKQSADVFVDEEADADANADRSISYIRESKRIQLAPSSMVFKAILEIAAGINMVLHQKGDSIN